MKEKSILFLSGIDFKDKSIQVVHKTPEAYIRNGYDVNYIVYRDNSKKGNYFYESEKKLEGANLQRFYWPFPKLRAVNNRFIALLFTKLSSLLVVYFLFIKGFIFLLKNRDCKIIYGYEMQGVLASNLLKIFFKNKKYISRFQGVYYIKEHFLHKRYLNLLFNLDTLLALWLPSDLMVMTNDGTQGDQILDKIKSLSRKNLLFISNGVNNIQKSDLSLIDVKSEFCIEGEYFILVSRLTSIKRVHFLIEAFNIYGKKFQFNYKFYVVGDGPDLNYLKNLVLKYKIEDFFCFLGAIDNIKVYPLLKNSKAIFSLYESSNIGNPFFEAMQCGTPMVAVNNGDTGLYIKDGVNGLLINEDRIVEDLLIIFDKIINNKIDFNKLSSNALDFSKNNILTWKERFDIELERVGSL
ncbi:glycosyltransferase [Acinetobacter chinensis]|uniref:glycosyltransferase n=1 Tax=Acinetobacter chinensis TaxID=2004650 RepID=UPI002934C062|nr:glycosyltransferase [Acinetobacter chinensis]WOE41673.1 glycosyltransferase [Acinetobacter chinensis]